MTIRTLRLCILSVNTRGVQSDEVKDKVFHALVNPRIPLSDRQERSFHHNLYGVIAYVPSLSENSVIINKVKLIGLNSELIKERIKQTCEDDNKLTYIREIRDKQIRLMETEIRSSQIPVFSNYTVQLKLINSKWIGPEEILQSYRKFEVIKLAL